jgi:NADH-quinone oxidoreductase subunit N
MVDHYALFFTGLILLATLVVVILSYGYHQGRRGRHEERYLPLLLAALGGSALTGSRHFAAFFLSLELLSVALFALIAYPGYARHPLEAGVKYLVLAGVSSSFLLFGMALIYAELGTMDFSAMGDRLLAADDLYSPYRLMGLAMIMIGVGFKLSLAPFHFWTPDVYEGAPAPVTAFLATVSKGAVFALLLRYLIETDAYRYQPLLLMLSLIAIASMLVGNLLALLQTNVKRILAYSSIAHLGYLLVALLAGGALAVEAVSYYLVAYFVTTLGAFGIVTLLSGPEWSVTHWERNALEDYRGLFWQRPWLAGMFTAMLLSLAGIPLTAGFIGKFYVFAAGAQASLWWLLIVLIIGSALGLCYYLRIIMVMTLSPLSGRPGYPTLPPAARLGGMTLILLALLLVWLGIYPAPLIELIPKTAGNFTIIR